MQLSKQTVTVGLSAKADPQLEPNSAIATVGTLTAHSHAAATVVYAVLVTAGGGSDIASVVPLTGVCFGSGTPAFERPLVDFEGIALPTSTKVHGLRLRAGAANVGTVTQACTNSPARFPSALAFPPGADFAMSFGAAGAAVVGGTVLSFTFTHAGDTMLVEFLGA